MYASVNWVSIGSGNGLSPVRRQAITGTSARLLSIGPLGTEFTEIQIEILTFSFKKMRLKMSSVKWQPFCPGGDELIQATATHVMIGFVYFIQMSCVTWLKDRAQGIIPRNAASDLPH